MSDNRLSLYSDVAPSSAPSRPSIAVKRLAASRLRLHRHAPRSWPPDRRSGLRLAALRWAGAGAWRSVDEAVSAWCPAELADHGGAKTAGVLNPYAVLTLGLANLPDPRCRAHAAPPRWYGTWATTDVWVRT